MTWDQAGASPVARWIDEANPAVTLARGFTQTFAGIALGDVAGFIAAQLVGAALGAWLSMALFPAQGTSSTHVIAPGE